MKNRPCCTNDYGVAINSILLLLRIVVSILLLSHGLQKMVMIFDGNYNFPDPIGLGSGTSLYLVAFAEVVCPLFILMGYRSRLAVIPVIIFLLVALFWVHGIASVFDHWNILLYLLALALLLHLGAGGFSLTYYFYQKKYPPKK